MTHFSAFLGACIAALAGMPICASTNAPPAHVDRTRSTSGAMVAQWNELAHELAFAEDRFTTFKGQRAIAMMHLAQHDALNSICPLFDSYVFRQATPTAEPRAAVAHAAREVLVSQYPTAQAQIDTLLAQQLGDAGNSSHGTIGRTLGRAAAAAILEARQDDGWDDPGVYEFRAGPGMYQTTPDWHGFVVHPGLAQAKPFLLESASQWRPHGPPALDTRAYASALNEVQQIGAEHSRVRTADQTHAAVWWMEFSEGLMNRWARRQVVDDHWGLWRTTRLFALMNAALVDTYVAVWDSKYAFNHWRPYTAIRDADTDGNSATLADHQWQSLRPAPPFPEYVSAHAAGCACTLAILDTAFGKQDEIVLDSLTATPGESTRTFGSFHAAARECADSRIWLGFHFRYSTRAGTALGYQIARYALAHGLLPTPR
ncbi:hypothetical protein [Povalibacter sp.]|uniref:vanadium-dependent haloperoxidase n=1 Tax=Povalibacter sp. TaxID=1962978 RepID=UPI002F403192